MKRVLLCIRCKHGVYLNMPLAENVANALIKGWSAGNLPLTKAGMIEGSSLPECPLWSIKAEDIVLIHTQEINAGSVPGQTPSPWAGGPRGSGI